MTKRKILLILFLLMFVNSKNSNANYDQFFTPIHKPSMQPNNYKLSVPVFSQLYPDFIPMGCECVSINMAFDYKGISMDVNKFIEDIPTIYDPRKGFMGDMYSFKYYNGTVPTIWPEALIGKVQDYRSKSYVANSLTLEEIEREVFLGNPVLVWYSWEP